MPPDPWQLGADPWTRKQPPAYAAPDPMSVDRAKFKPDTRETPTLNQETTRRKSDAPPGAQTLDPVAPDTSTFPVGARVKLKGLKKEEMNGLRGEVSGPMQGPRVPVLLDGKTQPTAVKPENLVIDTDMDVTASASASATAPSTGVASPAPPAAPAFCKGSHVELINQEPGRRLANGMRGVVSDYIPEKGKYVVQLLSLGGASATLLPSSMRSLS